MQEIKGKIRYFLQFNIIIKRFSHPLSLGDKLDMIVTEGAGGLLNGVCGLNSIKEGNLKINETYAVPLIFF